MNEIPKLWHRSKGTERRKVKCLGCDEERLIVIAPSKKPPERCAKCSRKRAAQLWNGRKALDDG